MTTKAILPADQPGARVTEPNGAPRIAVLDILRGVAILGILFMNVNDMGQSFGGPDIRHFGWGVADQIAWWLRAVLADGTARAMLEMLFGAGMVILTDRIATGAVGRWSVMRRYYWRNIMLWLFGLVHIFVLLWPGDILHTYGIAALVAFWFRRLRPRWLFAIGLIGATVQFGAAGYFGVYQGFQSRAQVATLTAKKQAGQALTADEAKMLKAATERAAKRAEGKKKHAAEVAKEDIARSSTSANWVREQWRKAIERLTGGEIFSIWEAAGTMLIGAALFKLGILQGLRTRAFYIRMTLVSYAIALPLRAWDAYGETRFNDLPQVTWATYEYARLLATLGHVGLLILLANTALGARLLRPFVAAGRTALTLYVLQTIAFLWVLFPPFGLGLYGAFGWMQMMLLCVALNAVLLWAANAYMWHFAIAPVEWAWRSIVEGRVLPWRRAPLVVAAV